MEIATKLDFGKVPANQNFNVRLLISIEADEIANKDRQPLNISVVLDRSGSMYGDKLEYIKNATNMLVEQLGKEDYFSLTVYNSKVDPLVKPGKVNEITGLNYLVDSIKTSGTTNLSEGYKQGCEFADCNNTDETISRVLLLSDGHANEGITDINQLAEMAGEKYKDGIVTTTIGVGGDYDENLLGMMAESGGGGTYFIETPDDAPSVFAEELGYLCELMGTKLEVEFVTNLKNIQYDQLNTYHISKENYFVLGDIYSKQKKSLLLELKLPPLEVNESLIIGEIKVNYVDKSSQPSDTKSTTLPISIEVVNNEEFENFIPEIEVNLQTALLLIAKAKAEAIKLSDEGKFEDAAKLIEEFVKIIENMSLDDNLLKSEIDELQHRGRELRTRKDEFYTNIEKKRMFFESDKMSKSNHVSYNMMVSRRQKTTLKNQGNSFDYQISLVAGHIIAKVNNNNFLVDTGSIKSFGSIQSMQFCGTEYYLNPNFMGVDVHTLTQLTGIEIDGLLGIDILHEYEYILDLEGNQMTLFTSECQLNGIVVPFNTFMEIPIIEAQIGRNNVTMLIDTGAHISYLDRIITKSITPTGEADDFYPGIGRFKTPTYDVNFSVSNERFLIACGILPEILQKTLDVVGSDGILGTEFFEKSKVCIQSFQKQIVICPY